MYESVKIFRKNTKSLLRDNYLVKYHIPRNWNVNALKEFLNTYVISPSNFASNKFIKNCSPVALVI